MTSFRDFEHERWQEAVETYAGFWAGLTRQTVRPLLDALEISPETRLLDVSCGTGHVAAAAASMGASVVGIDFSSVMLSRARGLHPTLDFRLGDAEELEFPDESFDAVAVNFGMLHFQHPERALAQAHRVLRPGGRAAYTVWAPPDQSPGLRSRLRLHPRLRHPGSPVATRASLLPVQRPGGVAPYFVGNRVPGAANRVTPADVASAFGAGPPAGVRGGDGPHRSHVVGAETGEPGPHS